MTSTQNGACGEIQNVSYQSGLEFEGGNAVRYSVAVSVLVCPVLGCACVTAAAAGTITWGGWRLELDAAGAGVTEVAFDGQVIAKTPPPGVLGVDVLLSEKPRRWLVEGATTPARRERHEWDPAAGTLVLRRRQGDWELREHITLLPERPRLMRRLNVTYRGREDAKFYDARFLFRGVIAADPEGFYALPARFPPHRRAFAELSDGARSGHGRGTAPLLVQQTPHRTLLFLSDDRADPARVDVREHEARLSIEQGFALKGWVRPNVTHDIGSAYMGVIAGPYESGLRAIWDWMDDVDLRVPSDRPDWVRDAVLYCFHPGGTIGSNCLDLGGFAAAREQLMPLVARLGATAIWVMPLEDRSIYHPRDYYKFQGGLGTPEEYRALVAEAHRLGLKVWQDLVPHGASPAYGPLRGNPPGMLAYDEEGKTLNYWCYDFRHCGWQQYIAQVAEHYVRTYGIEGYRIDAVGGSKIPNWNHLGHFVPMSAPYARASLAKREGGLQMIATIRNAVKKHKPFEGSVLAEVNSSPPYAAAADVVYDFTLCGILARLRQTPPAEFVKALQRWLEEQKHADPRGTVRLRYIESHDTVRAQGRYGVSATRALAALTTWTDGMPMIYHEMEIGHQCFLRRVFEVRQELPELRRGEAFYRAVQCETPGVFTCLRLHQDLASVVLINLNPHQVEVVATLPIEQLPLKANERYAVYDAMPDRWLPDDWTRNRRRTLTRTLEGWEATVLAIRPAAAQPPKPALPETPAVPSLAPSRVELRESPDKLVARSAHYRLTIDKRTGLLAELHDGEGRVVSGASDLGFEPDMSLGQVRVTAEREGDGVRISARMELTIHGADPAVHPVATVIYHCLPKGEIDVQATLAPSGRMSRAMWVFSCPDAARWQVNTAEGLLDDDFVVRHRSGKRGTHGIYWRPQGTDVAWQSQMVPLDTNAPFLRWQRDGSKTWTTFSLADTLAARPENVMLLDKWAGREGMHVAIAWRDETVASPPGPATQAFRFRISFHERQPRTVEQSRRPALSHASTHWVIENEHYRVLLSRAGGTIRELWLKQPAQRLVLSNADMYSNSGFIPKGHQRARTYLGAKEDGETGIWVWRDGESLRLRFFGQVRGGGRFSLSRPPVWFYTDYTFTDAPTFRMSYGVRSDGGLKNSDAFLAFAANAPEVPAFALARGDATLARGDMPTRDRVGETKGKTQPDAVTLLNKDGGVLLRLSEVMTTTTLCNVFVHGWRLYLAWLDFGEETMPPRRWFEATMLVTAGDSSPRALPPGAWQQEAGEQEAGEPVPGVFNPSFEVRELTSLLTKHSCGWGVPRADGASGVLAWSVPRHGSITTDAAHQGRRSANVVHEHAGMKCYCLFRQRLDLAQFPPGSKVRLSAWVKGRGIVRGDISWKTGTVRLTVRTADGKVHHIGTPQDSQLVGTYDWRRVELSYTIPANAVQLWVEAGLNGAPDGVIWIDEVRVARSE